MSRSPLSPPLRVRLDGDPLIVGFAVSRRVSTHRQLPQLCVSSGPPDGSRSITPYAPGVGASDQRFLLLPLLPALRVPASYCIWLKYIHDANDPAPARGIDGFHKFSVFPLATPTRTSLVLFESLLPLLTGLFSLLFVLLSYGPTVTPREFWPVPDSSRTVVSGRRFVGPVELMGRCLVGR